jgi:myo-inositol-1(or 4)-monophosphatase
MSTSVTSPSPRNSMSTAFTTPSQSVPDLHDSLFLDQLEASKLDLGRIQDDLIALAKVAGDMMRRADPSVDTSLEKKNSSDRVTATDKAIEDMIKTRLAFLHPTIDFLGEETFKDGQVLTDKPTFVCDPIDGTLNFIHGFPNVAVSLALTLCKRPIVGVIYNPFRGDLYTAIKGKGALYTNARGTTVSLPVKPAAEPIGSLEDCLIAVEWGSERFGPNWELRSDVAIKLLTSQKAGGAMIHSMRSNGAAALDFAYVAAGWLDGFWEGGCWIWDVCAGWLLVEEAGGLVAGANPGEWNPTLEGRSYFCVRGAASGQKDMVEKVWSLMGNRKFDFPIRK